MSLTPDESRLVGASDMGALLGLSEWSGPVALWARIVHGVHGETTEAMSAGTLAEPYIRALYQQQTGYELLGPAKWRHPLYPWLRCSPDDRARAPEERRVLELKKYQPHGWGPEGTDAVPLHIWAQVQVQIGVGLDNGELEQDTGDVAALIRGDLRLYSVPFQPEAYARCLGVGERFWVDFVLPKRMPDGPNVRILERDAAAIRALYPAPTQAELLTWEALTETQRTTVQRWLEANKARKAWEKEERGLAAEVEALLREVPGLTLPKGRVDYAANKDSARTDWEAIARVLMADTSDEGRMRAIVKQHTTTIPGTRPLVARGT
jgi:predicted phage-related endonuclease